MQNASFCHRLAYWHNRCVTKIVLAMTLTGVLFLAAALHVAARTVSQTVTLSGKNLPVKQVFQEIKKQTGFSVFYDKDLLENATRITIDVRDIPLTEFLTVALRDQPFGFYIENENIIIRKKEKPVSPRLTLEVPPIAGTITGPDGKPLAGVNITVKGSMEGTTTDAYGNFSINVEQGSTLIVSAIGYATQTIKITSTATLAITMQIAEAELDEVVVNKGYYSESKRLSTGNVTTVTSEEIQRQPVANPIAALTGKVPGLQITQVSGLPGKGFEVQLRGRNSISSGNSPLYIIDGVPFYNDRSSLDIALSSSSATSSPLSILNPADIENISVLKDGDATAIYGPRGANGVILITTKKGKEGKTKYDFNISSGAGRVTRMIPLLNTQQYLEVRREAFKNDGVTTYPSSAYDINGTWDTTRYTDWQKLFIGNTSHYTDAQASVSGGNAQTQFLIGAGYHKETTIYPGDFNYKRGSVHTSVSHSSLNRRFRIDFSAMYSSDNNFLPLEAFRNFMLAPNAPAIYDSLGNLNWENSTWENPFRNLYATGRTTTDYLNSNLVLGYEILNGLKFKTSLGYTTTNHHQANLTPLAFYNPAETWNESSAEFGENNLKSWSIEPQFSYIKQLGKSRFDVLAGMSFFQQVQNGSVMVGTGYTSDALLNSLEAANDVDVWSNTYSLYRFVSLLGRINYTYDDKYILNLTGRRDGSTRFGPGKQYGNFGAVGAAWIFSDENWFGKLLPVVSFGKLKVSYGLTGNDQIGDYSYLDTYAPYYYTYQGISTLDPVRFLNQDYAWEINKKFEVGLDLGLLRDRINFSASYYSNLSGNQLLYYPLPNITGADNILQNLPAKVRNSGLEFTLNLQNMRTKDFRWTTNINLTVPIDQAKLLAYPDLETSNYANSYIIGKSLFIAKKLKYLGVDPETGIYQYEDANKNGRIDFPGDRQTIVFTGQQWYGGLDNSFEFKNFQVSFLLQYVRRKNAIALNRYINGILPGSMNNLPVHVLDRWQQPGDEAYIQRFSNANSAARTANFNMYDSDGSFDNGSFLRMRNLSVAYKIPGSEINSKGFPDFRVYLQMQNVFTITNLKGADPENSASLGSPPPLRVITAGLQVAF